MPRLSALGYPLRPNHMYLYAYHARRRYLGTTRTSDSSLPPTMDGALIYSHRGSGDRSRHGSTTRTPPRPSLLFRRHIFHRLPSRLVLTPLVSSLRDI